MQPPTGRNNFLYLAVVLLLVVIGAILDQAGFNYAHLFIAETEPDAFNGIWQGLWFENFATDLYASFVTTTTLGFGKVTATPGFRNRRNHESFIPH
jgi:hypothetical protein